MAIEEEPEPGVPEWVVTFGDLMSLLLTFFIMLVSMSEIKEEKQYQAMVESFRKQFGHDSSLASLVPGEIRPRNSMSPHVNSEGRAKRKDLWRRLQRLYVEELPVIPLYWRAAPFVLPKWLSGLRPTGHQGTTTLWIEEWRDSR